MEELLHSFFASGPFMAHSHCYQWKPDLVALHIISDSLITLAYYLIPITLVYFVQKRRDLPFNWIFLLFGASLVLCGTTHLMEVWTFWHPTYWLSGFLKALTAGVSVLSLALLVRIIPQALALPTSAKSDRHLSEEALKTAKAELEKNYNLLCAVIEGTPDPIFVKDLQGRHLMINEAGACVIGRAVEYIIGKDDTELFPSEIARQLIENDRQVITKGVTEIFEEVIYSLDAGEMPDPRTYLSTKSVYRDTLGNIIGLVGIARDITLAKEARETLEKAKENLEIRVEERTAQLQQAIEQLQGEIGDRQQAEEALQTTNQTLQTLILASPLAIATINTNGNVTMWNPAAERLFGWSETEVVGNPLPIVPTDKQEEFRAILQNELQGEEKTGLELRRQRKDNSLIDVSLWTAPLFDSNGAVVSIMALFADISDRVRAETALRESQQQLQDILDNSPAVIYLKDAEGRFIFINRRFETLFHIDREAIKGKTGYDLFPKEMADAFRANDIKVFQSGTTLEMEELAPQDDGLHTYFSSKFLLYDWAGVPYAICGISTDVTERKRAMDALQESQRFNQQIAETFPNFLYIYDLIEKCHTYSNRQIAEILGYAPEAIQEMGKDILENLLHPDDRVLFAENLNRIATSEDNGIFEIEYRLIDARGEWHWFRSREIVFAKTERGKPKQILGSAEDISDRKRAEEELRKSLKELSAIKLALERTAIVALTDCQGKITYVNNKFCEVSKYSREELIGQNHRLLNSGFHPKDFFRQMWSTIKSGKVWKGEINNKAKDGSFYWVETTIVPFVDEGEKPSQYLAIRYEITDRKRSEAALRQSEERYRSLIAATSQIVWITNAAGQVIDIVSWRAYTGQSPEQVKGWGWLQAIHPFDRDRTEEAWAQAVETKSLYETEYRIRGKDGGDRYFSARGVPVLAENGSIREWIGICIDIHELKQAEQEKTKLIASLQESEAEYIANFEQAAVGIGHATSDGRFLRLNQKFCDILGYTREELIQLSFQDISHPDDQQTVTEAIDAMMSGELSHLQYEKRYIRKDGSLVWVNLTVSVARHLSGELKYSIGVIEDISDRKQASEELRRSEARYREVAGREELLNRLANQIRKSLELNTILEIAVQEIRNLLAIERCNFTWIRSQVSPPLWEIVTESREPNLPSFLGEYPLDITDPIAKAATDLKVMRIDDTLNSTDPKEQRIYRIWGAISLVLLPIQTRFGDIGLFSCVQESGVRVWSDWEMELLMAVTGQLAIAIDQAELYKQSRQSAANAHTKANQLEVALRELQQTQGQLIQSEKMSSLGQLVAGVAHEINNPVNFIYGNITPAKEYTDDLLALVQLYDKHYPNPVTEIQHTIEAIELDFIKEDLPKILSSMKLGADRIRSIVLSLRNFSRLDESAMKKVDIHEGLDSTLLILQSRLKAKSDYPGIQVIKEYGNLPLVECYAGQLNQVFMNILSNAIDALEDGNRSRGIGNGEENPNYQLPRIRIITELADNNRVVIRIADNGAGMTDEVQRRLFDPFFTTKPVGSGTGLGMSISYQIVDKHGGQLTCISDPGQGAELLIEIPIQQQKV